jgi:antitoxin component of MazEF toxin-antitoxin module
MYYAQIDVDEDGNYVLVLPHSLVVEMGWKVDDEISFEIDENQRIILKKE